MKILLVEDDQRIFTSLAEALNDQPYVVDCAINGAVGWKLIQTFPYDLAVIAIQVKDI